MGVGSKCGSFRSARMEQKNTAILLVKTNAKSLSLVDLSETMSWVPKHMQMAAPQSDGLSDVIVMTDGTYILLIQWR
jgi:hypothetical protein